MSEEDPEVHRPRRAWREEPTESTSSSAADPEAAAADDESTVSDLSAGADHEAADVEESAAADDDTAVRPGGSDQPPADDEDRPKPLYRDESADRDGSTSDDVPTSGDGSASTGVRAGGAPEPGDSTAAADPELSSETPARGAELSDETTILSRARERKRDRARPDDDDETTLLPRTAAGGRVRHRDEADLDDDDDIEADPAADRRRLLWTIGAVAVVVVLGLLVGYAIITSASRPIAAPGSSSSPSSSDGGTPSGDASSTDATALLTDAMLLSPAQAETLDKKRTWKVALTQRGTSTDSANHPACLSEDTTEGAPVPQQTVLQLLSSDGADAPAALHQATAYSSPEEAAQAYAYVARMLGDCAMSGSWIYRGHQVSGVGDQAVGTTLQVLGGKSEEFRTVVLARTGRVVDIIDVARTGAAESVKRVTAVAGAVVDTQCQAAGGSCSDEPESADGPPPLGGDQPGFLASGDLPPMGAALTRWAGTTPGEPDADLLRGSGCETVNWAKVDAESRSHRTYLLADSSSRFGLDEVIITTENEQTATKLAEKVRDGWKDCAKRQLTATVADLREVSGPGAKSTDVKGWTTEVSQKADDKTTKYRVGIVSAGNKVAFVFLNPQDNLDLTSDQFDTVAVRAGQRATQVN